MTVTAKRLIIEERRRQLAEEGYTREHDRQQGWQPLAQAAQSYGCNFPDDWPDAWATQTSKPKGVLRNLVRSGALYVAAIEAAAAMGEYYEADALCAPLADVVGRLDLLLDEVRVVLMEDGEL